MVIAEDTAPLRPSVPLSMLTLLPFNFRYEAMAVVELSGITFHELKDEIENWRGQIDRAKSQDVWEQLEDLEAFVSQPYW